MVHLRSLLWLLFVLNALKDCSLAQQDSTKLVLAEDNISTAGKEIVDGFKAARKFGLGRGRKRMLVEEVKRKKKEKEGNYNGKKENEILGAKCFGQMKCEYEVKKNRVSVKCKIRENSLMSKKMKLVECGFVAFGDDYQAPKHHTPNHH